MNFYIDESGDLGWKFDAPYREGGSSRYLTIATLICPPVKRYLSARVITDLYKKFNWNPRKEKKWADMSPASRKEFTRNASNLVERNEDIKLFSITAFKENVKDHIRRDSNKLYNYMIGLSLLDEMACHAEANMFIDARSIKVASGNSLHHYLDINLSCVRNVPTLLVTKPCDSSCEKNIQFADMLAGLVQNHFEDSRSEYLNSLSSHLSYKKLYFHHTPVNVSV